MWRDIFLDNRAEVLRAIDGFGDAVARLRRMIESEEPHALEAELDRTRAARRRLKERRA
jgi:prephenate dehydrogenase